MDQPTSHAAPLDPATTAPVSPAPAVGDAEPDFESLVELLAERGPDAGLLSALAEAEELDDAPRLVADLYRLAAAHGGSVPAAAMAAVSAAGLLPFRQAIAALSELPAPVVGTYQVRAALGGTYLDLGLPALAVTAYGDPATLPADDRADRRRAWWLSGGPFGFARRRRTARDRAALSSWPPHGAAPIDELDVATVLARLRQHADALRRWRTVRDRVDQLQEEERYDEAVDALAAAQSHAEPVPWLRSTLWRRRAEIEEQRNRQEARLRDLAAAVAADPDTVDSADELIVALTELGRFRAGIEAADALPERIRHHPDVRTGVTRLYLRAGLPARAVAAMDRPRTRAWRAGARGRSWWRSERRRAWWRTGGPLPFLRNRFLRRDERFVDRWRVWSDDELARFDSIAWPAGFEPAGMRAAVDGYLLRWVVLDGRRWTAYSFVKRILLAALGAAVAVALFLVGRQAGVPAGTALGTAAATTLVTFGVVRLAFLRWSRVVSRRSELARGVPTCVGLAVAGYAVFHFGPGLPGVLAGAVLGAAAVLAATHYVAVNAVWLALTVRILRHHRRHARESILDDLLAVLVGVAATERRNDLSLRGTWMQYVENAARAVERDLPKALEPGDPDTVAWAAERARGAAAALRRLKRRIAAPYPGSWDRLEAVIVQQVVAVATGDLGTLRWVAPPSPAAVRRSRWRTAFLVVKALVLAALPLAVVLIAGSLLGLTGSALLWARIVGAGWALLYLMLTVDPDVRDKIETTRSLLTSVREVGKRD